MLYWTQYDDESAAAPIMTMGLLNRVAGSVSFCISVLVSSLVQFGLVYCYLLSLLCPLLLPAHGTRSHFHS